MIKYVALIVAIVLMGAPLVHAYSFPFWTEINMPTNPGYRTIHVIINHVNTLTDTSIMRICVTDTNTTHGLCHYMNATEEEAQLKGNDVNVSAGFFTFPIDQAPFSTGYEIEVCLKVLDLHSERCTSYNTNFAGENETLSLDRRDVVPVSFGGTMVDKGNALIEQGNYTGAIQSFDKALVTDPNDKYALEGKGYALYNLGNYTEAIQYYDKVSAIYPNDELAQSNKGFALNNLGNYTQAIQSFDKALAIDPNDKYALHGQGNAFDRLGNYTGVIQYYDKALDIDLNYMAALYDKGLTLSNEGKFADAIRYYDRVLDMDPNNTHILNSKGNALNSLGNYTQALQFFNKALAMNPNDSDALKGKQNAISKR